MEAWLNEVFKGVAIYIFSSFMGEAILKSIGVIELPAISNHLFQLLILSTLLWMMFYMLKFQVDRSQKRKGTSLASDIDTLLNADWSRQGEESVRGTYSRLVLEGFRKLRLTPWQLSSGSEAKKFSDEELRAYLREIRLKLDQGIEEAQEFTRVWNERRRSIS